MDDIEQLISGFIELALQYEYMDIHLYAHTDYTEVECAICMEQTPFHKHHTACDHWFHVLCLRPWIEKSNSCPICRRPIF